MNNAAAQYLREVNRQIICPNSIKREFLHQLENEVVFFCADHADADAVMLSEQFGSPEEVAEEFLSELGGQTVKRCTRTRKRLLCLTFGVIVTAVIFAVIIGVQTYFLQQKLPAGEFLASITYVTEGDGGVFYLPSRDTIFDSKENAALPME